MFFKFEIEMNLKLKIKNFEKSGFSTFVFNYSLGTGIELKEFKILQSNVEFRFF